MSLGFPAYHTERYAARDTTFDLRNAVKETLNALSWPLTESTSDAFIASTNMNARSCGEKVVISFLLENSVSVTSKCAMPTQCLDWGKNKANVDKFMMELRNRVQQ